MMMNESEAGGKGQQRKRRRLLSASEKYEIWLKLVAGELSQNQAAEAYGVDRSTIARIRTSAKAGALEALASSQPGRPKNQVDPQLAEARDEVARLEETVKEQAIELVALRKKSRWG